MFTVTTDLAYDAAPINMWSFIELNLGLACACAPGLIIGSVQLSKDYIHAGIKQQTPKQHLTTLQ
ncbi:hypothetical protein BP5796_02826 [Coleophoma crateriformis]|uniref:Uncharacterized protein n=1 Tax=Coleophoma crateriformis TaxID=565419 RepID=A0A3D8SZR2_9HELO|nr:hypothetical protein BP5796_02826 [Coleophoma crateriformis]